MSACEGPDTSIYRPRALGPEGVVTIVMDSSQWQGPIGDSLRATLGGPISTLPRPEPYFRLRVEELNSNDVLERVQKLKNVLFVAPLTDTTNVAKLLRSQLSPEVLQAVEGGQGVYAAREDLYRNAQQIGFLTARDVPTLASYIGQVEGELVNDFETATQRRVESEMFERGRQEEIEGEILERHGFAVNVQHDYVIVSDTLNTMYLRRIVSNDSWRNLLIHWEENADPSTLSPEWMQETLDSLMAIHMQGNVTGFAQIDARRPIDAEEIDFNDRYGYEMRALWSMVGPDAQGQEEGLVQLGMGGPMVAYGFYDQASDRLYLIAGMVFAPNFEKRMFLRHMEIIARTFRTDADVAAANPEST